MPTSNLTADNITNSFDVDIVSDKIDKLKIRDKKSNLEFTTLNIRPRPFVKWAGGKRSLIKQFQELGLYPPKDFNPDTNTYFEPFVGGGAVFFNFLPNNAKLSDLNTELVITYNVIKNNVGGLIKSLQKHRYNKDYYLEIRAQNPDNLTDIEIASRFIFLNRTGFNGLYRVNKKGRFNVPFGKYKNPIICDEQNLLAVSYALKNVSITHSDYKSALQEAKKGDFIYLDPPYYPINKTSSFTSYTADSFLEKEQTELRDTFIELNKKGCFVMLSNSDTHFIQKLYSGINGINFNRILAGRAINSKSDKRGKITELLITNY